MAPYTYSPGSDLPEHIPSTDKSYYKYSVTEGEQPQVVRASQFVHTYADNDSQPPIPTYTEKGQPGPQQSRWTRWPLLLLYGIILMLVAGLAGGFIGKTLEAKNHSTAASAASSTCPSPAPLAASPISSTAPTASTPTSSSTSSAPPAASSSSAVFERTIASPTSGCSSSSPYRSFKSRSNFFETPYTTICGQGWLENELTAINVATQSDCIESCIMYNAHKLSTDRKCVGGGFIPTWWDQQTAMKESGGTPFNCFLKTNTSGIARNNKSYEVVALCMEGECDDIQG